MELFQNSEQRNTFSNRLQAIFDGVVAVALTMMALNIGISDFSNIFDAQFIVFLTDLTSYLISFIAVAVVWHLHAEFFSYYSYANDEKELVGHFALMFIMTLFPVITNALSSTEGWIIKALYLAIYYIMNLLNLWLMRHAQAVSEKEKSSQKMLTDMLIKKYVVADDEKKLSIVKAIDHYNEAQDDDKTFAKFISSDIKQMIDEFNREKKQKYEYSKTMSVLMLIYTLFAVVGLMFGLLICYIVLLSGGIVCFLVHHKFVATTT